VFQMRLKGIPSKYKSRFYHYMGLIRVLLEKLKLFSKSRNSLSFMELEDHCFFLKCLPLIHIWVSSNPFHSPTPVCFLKMHFNIILSSAHCSYKWSLSVRFKPYLSCVFYAPPPWVSYSNKVWQRICITELLLMPFFQASFYQVIDGLL
jgi:hypothetical protein